MINDISPAMRSLLDTIAKPESGGAYNVRYGGAQGPQYFTDYSAHPNLHSPIPGTDLTSSAAGRYQFITPTWNAVANRLGLTDFSPANQDRAAADLARTTYKSQTGRDLETDLGDPGKYEQIASALHGQWPSIKTTNIAASAYGKMPATQVAATDPVWAASPGTMPLTTPIPLRQNPLTRLALLNGLQAQPIAVTSQAPVVGANGQIINSGSMGYQPISSNPLQQLQQLG